VPDNGPSHRLGTRAAYSSDQSPTASEGGGLPPGGGATDHNATPLQCYKPMWRNMELISFNDAST